VIDQTAEALTDLGNMKIQHGNDPLARRLYEEAMAIWRALGDEPGIVHLLEKLERLACRQDGTLLPAWFGKECAVKG
jgi:hypothetical protein